MSKKESKQDLKSKAELNSLVSECCCAEIRIQSFEEYAKDQYDNMYACIKCKKSCKTIYAKSF